MAGEFVQIAKENRWVLKSGSFPQLDSAMLILQKVSFDHVGRRLSLCFHVAITDGVDHGLEYIVAVCSKGVDDLTFSWLDGTGEPINTIVFSGCQPRYQFSMAEYYSIHGATHQLELSYQTMMQQPVNRAGPGVTGAVAGGSGGGGSTGGGHERCSCGWGGPASSTGGGGSTGGGHERAGPEAAAIA